jgi:hypothetical protein
MDVRDEWNGQEQGGVAVTASNATFPSHIFTTNSSQDRDIARRKRDRMVTEA